MATVEMTLDVQKPQECIEKVEGRQGDTATVIRVEVVDGGSPYDFTGKYLELALIRPDGEWVHVKDGCVQEGATNVWNCTLPVQATAYDGLIKLAYFVVRNTSDERFRDSTQRFLIDLDASATAEAHLGPYSDQVDRLIREAESIIDAWNAQMKAQQAAYLAAEARRDESYEAAEAERNSKYATAEQERDTRFEQSENTRQQTFNANESDRGRRSNEAVQAANQATERANDAAESVEQAVGGNLDPLFRDWIDAQKDVAGGLVSYDKYQREMVVADGETLLKTGSTISVKEKGLEAKHVKDLAAFRGALGLGATTSALPVANGGTGANTIEGARQNILNFPTNDELLSYLGLK